jgi:hypothetical protein
MSTILKALRRLEQERARARGAERPLREEVVIARARRRGAWGAWTAAGVALAIGFGATWAALTRFDEGASAPGSDPRAAAPVAAAPPVVAGASHAPASAAPPAAVASAPPASLAAAPRAGATFAGAPPSTPASPTDPASAAARTVTVAPGATAAVPRAPADASSRFAPRPFDEPPAPVPSTPGRVAAATPSLAPVREAAPPIDSDPPLLTRPITGRAPRVVDEPERSARAELPVSVVRTSWHPRPDRRTAWVAVGSEAPREVREGEWVGAYEVRAIEPDGVLFADGPLLVHEPVGAR